MAKDQDLRSLFINICSAGGTRKIEEMDGGKFMKFFRDGGLLSPNLQAVDVDIIYTKVKPRIGRRIKYEHFKQAIQLAALRKGVQYNSLVSQALEAYYISRRTYSRGSETPIRFHEVQLGNGIGDDHLISAIETAQSSGPRRSIDLELQTDDHFWEDQGANNPGSPIKREAGLEKHVGSNGFHQPAATSSEGSSSHSSSSVQLPQGNNRSHPTSDTVPKVGAAASPTPAPTPPAPFSPNWPFLYLDVPTPVTSPEKESNTAASRSKEEAWSNGGLPPLRSNGFHRKSTTVIFEESYSFGSPPFVVGNGHHFRSLSTSPAQFAPTHVAASSEKTPNSSSNSMKGTSPRPLGVTPLNLTLIKPSQTSAPSSPSHSAIPARPASRSKRGTSSPNLTFKANVLMPLNDVSAPKTVPSRMRASLFTERYERRSTFPTRRPPSSGLGFASPSTAGTAKKALQFQDEGGRRPSKGKPQEPLQLVFDAFCGATNTAGSRYGSQIPTPKRMDSSHFLKLCKESGLLTSTFTSTYVDIIFSKIKSQGEKRISFQEFQEGLRRIGQAKQMDYFSVEHQVVSATSQALSNGVMKRGRVPDARSPGAGRTSSNSDGNVSSLADLVSRKGSSILHLTTPDRRHLYESKSLSERSPGGEEADGHHRRMIAGGSLTNPAIMYQN